MRKVILIHIMIVSMAVLCACSPWLVMMLLNASGAAGAETLEDFGLGIGILGMAITPLGLLVAGVYIIAAIVFHFVFTYWRKSSGKPATQGYILTWLLVVLVGSMLCIAFFSISTLAQNVAKRARITPPVLTACSALLENPPSSPWQNGSVAVGVFDSNPEDGGSMRSLLILNPDGSLLRSLPLHIALHSLAWSPNGAQLALSDETNLYLLDPRGGDPRPITSESRLENNASLIAGPAWSPDGSLIYFEKRLPGEAINLEIFAMRPDGSDLRQLSDAPGYNISPQPSPDGSQIAFVSSRDGGSAIYIMGSDGSNPRRLSFGESIDADPAWSPDGQWLAFLSNRSNTYQVYILNASSGETCQLTGAGMQPSAPVWSPDGKFILFHDQTDNVLVLVSPDGGDVQRWQVEKLKSLRFIALGWAAAGP